jgi:bifunctional non-homologous end joining protein LigD
MSDEAIDIEGVRITHPEKVLYPEQGVTKRELAEYAVKVAPFMLPHVARRPITLVRCPTGRQRKCFYQRHAGSGVPEPLHEVVVPAFAEAGPFLWLEDAAGLVALVQMGVLEIHPWGARIDRPDLPDRLVFDLDPGEGLGFADVVRAGLDLRERLKAMGLTAFAKTTGGKGLHLVLPLERRHDWPTAKAFARQVAETMAAEEPDRFLTKISKAARTGKIFVDYLRNDATSTAVAPYSTRARAGCPVATPLAWDEVVPELDPAAFNVRTIPTRLGRKAAQAWAGFEDVEQVLPELAAPVAAPRRRAARR